MDPRQWRIADFSYALPEERIAQFAVEPRDAAKMLTYDGTSLGTSTVSALPREMQRLGFLEGGHLVLNETRVVQARLFFPRGDAKPFELFYLHPAHGSVEQAMAAQGRLVAACKVRYSKKWKANHVLEMGRLRARRVGLNADLSLVEFTWEGPETWSELLAHLGQLPLPPYMQRKGTPEDQVRYQTVFARVEGSVAAPTAGLHWTPCLLDAVASEGWARHAVRLHVGAGTFQPVSSELMADHPMHSEEFYVSVGTLRHLADGRPIWAVGTTSARTLESMYWLGCLAHRNQAIPAMVDQWLPYQAHGPLPSRTVALRCFAEALEREGKTAFVGSTALLIAPPYTFRMVDVLMTNFHQPQSTLLLLVAAAIGPAWEKAYSYALANDFRFLSYGDACLFKVGTVPRLDCDI